MNRVSTIKAIAKRFADRPACDHPRCVGMWQALHFMVGAVWVLLPEAKAVPPDSKAKGKKVKS